MEEKFNMIGVTSFNAFILTLFFFLKRVHLLFLSRKLLVTAKAPE